MKPDTRNKLLAAWQWCDNHDKSTGFMIEFMKDSARVDHDCVIDFIGRTTDQEREEWLKQRKLNDLQK